MKPLHIMDTTLRDAHQSLWATRMETGDMLPILPKLDQVGYWSIEMWGGATFDTCLRFLDENPWDRLRVIKQHCPNTPLQMLTRGQNLIGYHHYSRDIVNRFIKAAHRNGIDIFRVFDALNDIRNVVDNAEAMDQAVRYLKSLGHKKIGYLSHALGSYVYQQRYQAFFRAVQANGLPCSESLGKCDFFTSVCLSEHLPALLEQGCTAIVCSHDRLANSVLIDCQERGIRVPEDLSILGFDDLPLCRFTPPPLTTIRQNRAELGKSAYFALSSQLHDVSISLIQLHTELIVRSSCGKAPRRPQAKKRIPRAEPVTKKERNDEA